MKYYIGIDPSLTGTGICLMNAEGKEILFRVQPKKIFGTERLDFLERKTLEIIKPYFSNPCFIAIEGYAFGSFAGRERLGEWGGVLRLALYRYGILFVEVPPTTLKKYATGKGNTKKNQMLLSVYKKWGVTCASDDEADAYALARYGLEIDK